MTQIVLGCVLSFVVTFFLMPIVIRIAHIKNLYDLPDKRKAHTNPTSSLGGVAIFAGIVISLLLTMNFADNNTAFQSYAACFFIIFILGVIDDIVIISAWKKVVTQLLISVVLSFKAGLLIDNLHGFMGIDSLDTVSSHLFTFFTVIVIINAFNLIDGIDGLAGSLGVFSSIAFGIFYLINKDYAYALLAFSVASSFLGFLMYNFPPAKIFMGDCGSLLLGLIMSVMAIHFIQTAPAAPVLPITASPAIAFGVLLVPLMDALRVFIIRVSKGLSPFAPDRNHLHHLLIDKGFTHKKVTLTILAISVLSTVIVYFAQLSLGTTAIISSLVLTFFVSVYLLKRYIYGKRRLLHIVNEADNEDDNVRVVPIFNPTEKVVTKEE